MSVVFAHTLAPASALAFLEGIGAGEMVLVAIIGLLLFGGKGLPDMARTLGKVVREFKKATANVEEEVKRVMNEEPAPLPKPKPRPRIAPLPAANADASAAAGSPSDSSAALPGSASSPPEPPAPPAPPRS